MRSCDPKYNSESESEQRKLQHLIDDARKHQTCRKKYLKISQEIIALIQRSPRLYRAKDILSEKSLAEYEDIYGEALQITLCEINRKLMKYDKTKGWFMTWVNFILKYRVLDLLRKRKNERNKLDFVDLFDEEQSYFKKIADPAPSAQELLEVRSLVDCLQKAVEENKKILCKIYMRKNPRANAYALFCFLLPQSEVIDFDPKMLRKFAEMNNIEVKKLQRFYRDRCLEYLQSYVVNCGWEPPIS